jgi:L-asparaginase II
MSNQPELVVKVYRGAELEATHYAHVAVVNGAGEMTHYLGDPDSRFMTRSVVKPFQALPLVMTGGADHFGFSDKQIALTCASHVGSDEHREVALSNLKLAGNRPEDLQCGTHWPIGMTQDKIYPLNGEDNDPLRHNCSGKHSGFLALARFLNEDIAHYLDPKSKTQLLVKQAVGDMCDFPAEQISIGIDGCSAPVFSVPIHNLAIGFAKLATGRGNDEKMTAAVQRIRQAIWSHPKMVSGEKRLDYDLKRSFPNNLVCKIGAEGLEGVGLADPGIGIAVKILDGNSRALGPVIVELLKQLGLIDKIGNFPLLQKYEMPEIKNYREIVTGKIAAEFKLRKV